MSSRKSSSLLLAVPQHALVSKISNTQEKKHKHKYYVKCIIVCTVEAKMHDANVMMMNQVQRKLENYHLENYQKAQCLSLSRANVQ